MELSIDCGYPVVIRMPISTPIKPSAAGYARGRLIPSVEERQQSHNRPFNSYAEQLCLGTPLPRDSTVIAPKEGCMSLSSLPLVSTENVNVILVVSETTEIPLVLAFRRVFLPSKVRLPRCSALIRAPALLSSGALRSRRSRLRR